MLATSTHAALADLYLDRLAFDWQRRQRALQSHELSFDALQRLDTSLQACSQALALTAEAAAPLIAQRLQDPLARGELFAIAWHALTTGNASLHAACVALVRAVPHLRSAYAAALEWATPQQALMALDVWGPAMADTDAHTAGLAPALAVLTATAHAGVFERLHRGSWWQGQIRQTSQPHTMQLALLQCALRLPDHRDLEAAALAGLTDGQMPIRRAAAELVLYRPWQQRQRGLVAQAHQILQAEALGGRHGAGQALLPLACGHIGAWNAIKAELARQESQTDLYLQALGWCGDIAGMPVLIEHLEHPKHARMAGASIAMLTGSLPARDRWLGAARQPSPPHPPDLGAEIPDPSIDADLPQPDKAGFVRWWTQNAHRFAAQHLWLGGRPGSRDDLLHILRTGKLSWRVVAARRLQALQQGPRCPTALPSAQQLQWLPQPVPTRKTP